MRLYHCTKRRNLPSILRIGLLPHKPARSKFPHGVYLSKVPFDWMEWAAGHGAGALIEVDVTGLELEEDYNDAISKNHPSYYYPGRISPERFTEIAVSTDREPVGFKVIIKKERIF